MRKVAAWVLNGTHWFSLLRQPMMIVIWCRDWDDASRFQYLTQILQVNVGNYIPRYQIFVEQEDEVDKLVQHWRHPPLYGMVNQSLASWQRRILMIYRQLVSSISIQCGPFQLLLSVRIGNQ